MKLAFSTLGCPEWDLDTIIARARAYGYDGVDFRGYRGQMDVWRMPEFTTGLKDTAAAFRAAGLAVPAFSSSITLMPPSPDRARSNREELDGYLGLCAAFGSERIRVFGGGIGALDREEAVREVVASLRELMPAAERAGVTLALETHDDWTRADQIRTVMESIDSPALGVLWDIHHPYRHGEPPQETWHGLGRWIRYTHWKDARCVPGQPDALCLTGEGDLPLAEFLRVLRRGGYDGWLTFEWELKWHPELEPPEVAFPGFVSHIRRLLDEA